MAVSLSLLCLLVVGSGCLAIPHRSPTNTSKPYDHHPEPKEVQWDSACKCGQKGSGRIVGGTQASVNEYPWQAALMSGSQQFCGGSLINDRYILTAAHCVDGITAAQLTVRLAEHNLASSTETNLVTRSVSSIISHSQYNDNTMQNDIALLKLSSPVEVSSDVLPVCLPPSKPTYAGKTAIATGWGTTSSGGSQPNTLREVSVPVISDAQCKATGYGNSDILPGMLCAGTNGKDSCQGDSGGPLIFKDGGGNYDQIGVVSFGYGCGASNYPGVYTRVNSYLDWITENTDDGVYCKGMKL